MRGIAIVAAILAAAVAFATPALAEVVTLQCVNLPGAPLAGTQFTVDFDLDAGVVRFTNGITYRVDNVTDRYVYYGSREIQINESPYRLDRKTGVMEDLSATRHIWGPQANCRRVQGKVL